jgi:hypothetical protein
LILEIVKVVINSFKVQFQEVSLTHLYNCKSNPEKRVSAVGKHAVPETDAYCEGETIKEQSLEPLCTPEKRK